MAGYFGRSNDSIEFREIVLQHIKKILEISSSELRDKTITKNHGTFYETTEQEDTRVSYVQSIENLAYILLPYFDNDTKNIYDECIPIINGFSHEIIKALEKDYEEIKTQSGKNDIEKSFVIEMKIRKSKILFIAINKLLHKNDYLKTAIYGESPEDIIEVNDDDFIVKDNGEDD